jgi:TonB-dependent SusC/RagA subfamily outer membrane receptor
MKLNRNVLSIFKDGQLKKCMRIMKLSSFLILFLTLQMSASVWSQTTTMSVKLKNSTLQELFLQIEKSSNYRFFYNNDEVDVNQRISVDAEEKTVGKILTAAFEGLPYSFKELDNKLILIERNGAKPNPIGTTMQQQKSVSGRVTDTSGASLPGVSVVVKGTTNGTITDGNGNYSLSNVPENGVMQFSFVGMKGQEISVGNKTTINVTMAEDAIGIEEVVAIGYGTMKKSDLTGSVVSVKSDQLVSFPVSGAVQALQGRAAGVQISSNNGDPGGSMRVRVRGGTSINASSDPIFVVDGFVGGILPPPEDIESIEILKDASATAIYGSRGANGVIMVTTKKGTKGKTRIEFNTSYSSQKEIKRLDLLNAQQYTEITKEAFPNYVSSGDNTDWQDVISRTEPLKITSYPFLEAMTMQIIIYPDWCMTRKAS